MWSDQIFSSCKSAIYDYETLTFTAAQKRTLIAEIHLSWHAGQYDIKSMKATTNFSSWISIIPDEPNLRVVQNVLKIEFDFENLIFTVFSSARVCTGNKASIIEPSTNVFLACWKFITLCKLTQLSLLFKVIKHLEYTL